MQLNKENKQEAETFCFVLHYEIAISQLGAAVSTQTVLLPYIAIFVSVIIATPYDSKQE